MSQRTTRSTWICWIPLLLGAMPAMGADPDGARWTSDFRIEPGELGPTGRNPWFVLEPGYRLVLAGGDEQLTITVLAETREINDVNTRVVEERETKRGELTEVSRNFFAISGRTNAVYYFGEEVDVYRDGQVSGHGGGWQAGTDSARCGLIMPGEMLLGSRFYQEIAPGEATDRAEVVGLHQTVKTPAGELTDCIEIEETTPLEPEEREYKYYAPGIGLVRDGALRLVGYGPAPSSEGGSR